MENVLAVSILSSCYLVLLLSYKLEVYMKEKVILLVEDNPSDIALTKRALEKGCIANKMVVIEDGKAALEYLKCTGKYSTRDKNDWPTVVLLDIKLPFLDGHEVLKEIRKDPVLHRLPVVMMTSSKEETDVAKSYDQGVNSFIRKPVDSVQFSEAIKTLGLYWLVINEPPPSTK